MSRAAVCRRSTLLLGLCACPKPQVSPDDAALAAALEAADRAWDARGTGGLDPVGAALKQVPSRRVEVPDVRWRWARLEIARGLTEDDESEARRAHARARDHAMRCVLQVPGLTASQRMGTLSTELDRVDAARAPCAAWAGLAWTRWYVTLDPSAATLDLPVVDGLLAVGLGAGGPSREAATYGVVLLAAARPEPDALVAEEARATLARAATEDLGDAWVRWEDVVRLLPRPIGTAPGRAPATPEERGSVRRLTGGRLYRPSTLERLEDPPGR